MSMMSRVMRIHASSQFVVQSVIRVVGLLAGFAFVSVHSVWGQGTTELLVKTGDQVPGVVSPVSLFHPSLCNLTNEGRVLLLFRGEDDGDNIVLHQDGQLTVVVTEGTPELDRPYGWADVQGLSEFTIPVLASDHADQQSLFVYDVNTAAFEKLFTAGEDVPDGNGKFQAIRSTHVSRLGNVASVHKYSDTNGGSSDQTGVWLWDGNKNRQIARKGETTPDGNDTHSGFMVTGGGALVNDNSQVLFPSLLNLSTGDKGLYLWDGNNVMEVARDGDNDPQGSPYLIHWQSAISDQGDVAFAGNHVYLWQNQSVTRIQSFPITFDTTIFTAPATGILEVNERQEILFDLRNFESPSRQALGLLKNGEAIRVVEDGQLMPDGRTYEVDFPGTVSVLNENGVVAFKGESLNAGTLDSIYLTDGEEYLRVVQEGDVLNGGIVVEKLEVDWSVRQGGKFLNDLGQVVYLNQDASTGGNGYGTGSVHLFTPDLSWRSDQSGLWDDKDNWTLGLPPAHVHQVTIAGSFNITVTGPADDVTVQSLVVGGNPEVRSELQLQDGDTFDRSSQRRSKGGKGGFARRSSLLQSGRSASGQLTTQAGMAIEPGGVLAGSGVIGGNVNQAGELSPGGPAGEISFGSNLVMQSTALTAIDIDGINTSEFDRIVVHGDVTLDGRFDVRISNPSILSDGQTLVIGDFFGSVSGEFEGLPEGTVVFSDGNLQVSASYLLGDGNDFGLVVTTIDVVDPFGRKLLDGMEAGGSLSDASISDNVYYELDPVPTSNPAKQIVDLILLGESSESNPSSFAFRVEAAMSGGPEGDVIQTIELWNEVTQQWELQDSRPVTSADTTVHVTPTGDVTRFVHPLTDEITARVRWTSPEFSGATFDWSIDIDLVNWLID